MKFLLNWQEPQIALNHPIIIQLDQQSYYIPGAHRQPLDIMKQLVVVLDLHLAPVLQTRLLHLNDIPGDVGAAVILWLPPAHLHLAGVHLGDHRIARRSWPIQHIHANVAPLLTNLVRQCQRVLATVRADRLAKRQRHEFILGHLGFGAGALHNLEISNKQNRDISYLIINSI